MTATIIALEGIDGSGKTSQKNRLRDHLVADNYNVDTISFPRYHTLTGQLIHAYLHGEFGDPTKIKPEYASIFYFIDRYFAFQSPEIQKILEINDIVLLDRSGLSNLAYQAAKIDDPDEKIRFIEKQIKIEKKYGIPKPNLVIYLKINPEISYIRIHDAGKDKHESDLQYQKKVAAVYNQLADGTIPNKYVWLTINCIESGSGNILTEKQVHKQIYESIIFRKLLPEIHPTDPSK